MKLRAPSGLLILLCVAGTMQSLPFEARGDDAPKRIEPAAATPDALAATAAAWAEKAERQGGAEASASRERGAAAYFDLFQRYCQEPPASALPLPAEKCNELADKAARLFQSAHLVARAIQVRFALIAFDAATRSHLPQARRALYELAENYRSIAVYDRAAELYERFAGVDTNTRPMVCKLAAKDADADQALAAAVLLRLGLGQEAEATCAASALSAEFGGSRPAYTASVQFAIAAHYVGKEEWEKVRTTLLDTMATIDKTAAPDIQVQAHAALGRAYAKMRGGERQASREFAKVRTIWSSPEGAVQAINASYPGEDEGQRLRRLALTLTAVGEATFMAAEEKKQREVDTIDFPVYRGRGTSDDILAYVNTKVEDWVRRKSSAIENVSAEYTKVVDLQPAPPPRWVIAASSRVGLLWGSVVDEARTAPIPLAWRANARLRGIYHAGLEDKIERIKQRKAKPALVACVGRSAKLQYFDAYSRGCELWLSKNFRTEFHGFDELGPIPTPPSSGPGASSPPLPLGHAPGS